MPKPLCSRLEDLENEISFMLAMQQHENESCKLVKGKSITTHADGNVEEIEFEGTTCAPPKCLRPVSSPPKLKCSSKCDDQDNRRTTSGSRKVSRTLELSQVPCTCVKEVACPCSRRRALTPKKCMCGSKTGRTSKTEPPNGLGATDQSEPMATGESRRSRTSRSSEKGEPPTIESMDAVDTMSVTGKDTGGRGETVATDKSDTSKPDNPPASKKATFTDNEAKKAPDTVNQTGDNVMNADNMKKLQEYDSLQNKLKEMERKLGEAEKGKHEALSSSNELKTKYEQLRTSANAETEEMKKLKKEKDEMAKKLEVEIELRRNLEEKAKKAVQQERKSLTEKIEKIELHAVKSAKKVKKRSSQLTVAVKQKDDHIRRLSGTTEKLAESIRDKEAENKRLAEAHKEIAHNFMEAQTANKKLSDANNQLVKSVKDFQEKLNIEKNAAQKMSKQIADCKAEHLKSAEEVKRLKERLKEALQGPKDIKNAAKLQAKLEESREREQKWLDEATYLKAKMKEMQESQVDQNSQVSNEMDRMIQDHKRLQTKYDQLARILESTKADNEIRIQTMKEEFERYSQEMQKEQNHMKRLKDELQVDFDALAEASKQDRALLEQLLTHVAGQERAIELQQQQIEQRDKNIAALQEEIVHYKENIQNLEKQISRLEQQVEEARLAEIERQREIADLKQQVAEGREQLLLKEQLIAEQMSKIEDLKASAMDQESKLQSVMEEARLATDETKKAVTEMRKTSIHLEQVKEEKHAISAEIKETKEVIRDKVGTVTTILEEICKCHGDDEISKIYEQKVCLAERETTLQLKLIVKQKDQAVSAARFATQRLLETVADFQQQVEVYKKVQYMLTKMLQEKEAQLKSCSRKKKNKSQRALAEARRTCGNPRCPSNVEFNSTD